MSRVRPNLGVPYGTDGPWLAALLDVVSDLYDLLDARLPAPASAGGGEPTSGGAVPVAEPDRQSGPADAKPVTEPAPNTPPAVDEDGEPEEVTEPAPPVGSLTPPPRAGRGSGLSAWQAYAAAAGVDHPEDAGRADIIAACIKAGVIEDDQQ